MEVKEVEVHGVKWIRCEEHEWWSFYAKCPHCLLAEWAKQPRPKLNWQEDKIIDRHEHFGTFQEGKIMKGVFKSDMRLNEYQGAARRFATYPAVGHNWYYPAFGLAEEAGEVCGKFAKAIRDDKSMLTPERVESIFMEMGDVLWMLANLASEMGTSLAEIASANLRKLEDRLARNVIQGSGDNR